MTQVVCYSDYTGYGFFMSPWQQHSNTVIPVKNRASTTVSTKKNYARRGTIAKLCDALFSLDLSKNRWMKASIRAGHNFWLCPSKNLHNCNLSSGAVFTHRLHLAHIFCSRSVWIFIIQKSWAHDSWVQLYQPKLDPMYVRYVAEMHRPAGMR